MATHANSTTVPGVAAALMAEATARAEGKKATANLLAQALAVWMQDIHGGEWASDIEHRGEGPFVLIRMKRERRFAKPRGEVV